GSSAQGNGVHASFNNLSQNPFPPPAVPVRNGLYASTTARDGKGVLGENHDGGYGVVGVTRGRVGPIGIRGNLRGARIQAGAWGNDRGRGYGVKGTSAFSIGVYGRSEALDGVGVAGEGRSTGLSGHGLGPTGEGVHGSGGVSGVGVVGDGPIGVRGRSGKIGVF